MLKETMHLTVDGMSCNHCVQSIKKAVCALAGVQEVDVDLAGKTVAVVLDPSRVSPQNVKDAIEDQGYEVRK